MDIKSFFKKPLILLPIALILIIGLTAYFFNCIVSFLFPPGIEVGQSANFETLKFIVYLIGGGLLIWQIILTNRRTESSEKTADMAVKNIELLEKGQIQERFKNAIDQLGSAHEAVNLGAIYTLHHVAKDSPQLTKSVFDILCSYVRQVTSNKEYQNNETPTIKIQSILNLLFIDEKEREVYKGLKANLDDAYLSGAFLINANFSNASLCSCNFSKAFLKNANLGKANLSKANLFETNLEEANLSGAFLDEADFQDAEMSKSKLMETELVNVDFSGANLSDSNLSFSKLILISLESTFLCRANMCKTTLDSVNLRRTDLQDVQVDSPEWITKLKDWKCRDFENIENKYKTIPSEIEGNKVFLIKLKTFEDK